MFVIHPQLAEIILPGCKNAKCSWYFFLSLIAKLWTIYLLFLELHWVNYCAAIPVYAYASTL